MCIGLGFKNMQLDILEDAYFVVPARPVKESKVYTIPYMYPLKLGKSFPWILWVVFQQLGRDMNIFLW
jgi:hypothetical protein